MKDAFYKLGNIYRYLSTAIRNAKEEVNALGWKQVKNHENDQSSIWVELTKPPSGEDADGQVYQLFLKSKRIYETPEFTNSYIRAVDQDFKNHLLCLDRQPRTDTIYVHPNTSDLKKQREALRKLQTIPIKEFRPLLRLLEAVEFEHVKWPEFRVIELNQDSWELLWNDQIEGIENQRNFVLKALSTPDFALLEGPPGSGKTTTICELILQIAKKGGRIMLCGSTHVAIDNVLERIKDHNEIVAVRIGEKDKISEKVIDVQIDNILETETHRIKTFLEAHSNKTRSQEHLYAALRGPEGEQVIQNIILESANLVCGTSSGILKHPEIEGDLYRSNPIFDYLIIDEASKTTFVEFLVPALLARKWILVGDPQQLSPFVDRGRIEGIIRTHLPYTDRRACQIAFWASHRINSIIETEDEQFLEKLRVQAESFEESILELNEIPKNSHLQIGLNLLSSRILSGSAQEITDVEDLLPSDFGIAEVDGNFDQFKRRQGYWDDNQVDDYSEKNWEAEITWRLIRAHEMRKYPDEVEKLESQIIKLIPVYFRSGEREKLVEDIYRTGFIGLPSIIETLKEGFQFSRIRRVRFPSTLEKGMSRDVLEPRYEILTYQHRMHPEISKFPRKYVYKDLDALKDPADIGEKRFFSYIRYGSRSEWINVRVKEKMKQFNPHEVVCTLKELDLFISWARHNFKADNEPWEIAIITFYRAQEDELRKALRDYTGQKTNKFHFTIGNSILISLGTVDSFQGREADIVFLSFSRNRKVGFLNSLNRLNVAVTRAKYQLVLIGDKNHFEQVRNGYLLNDLAKETISTIIWSER